MMQPLDGHLRFVILIISVLMTRHGAAQNCDQTSVGLIPVDDLGSGLYLGLYEGGLYANGSNIMPAAHLIDGIDRAQQIVPLNTLGEPDPQGLFVLLGIGMSNTTLEFREFIQLARAHPTINNGPASNGGEMAIIDGAYGGATAVAWDDPADLQYDRVRDQKLGVPGLTEAQVQVVWVKVANPGPSVGLPDANADALALLGSLGDIVRALQVRYPNLKLVFFSSRIYAGYATTTLNPEPYAYESAFSNKWVIDAQIQQMETGLVDPVAGDLDLATGTPWLGWGPYFWADGLSPRSDGLMWLCSDLQSDGTHPSLDGSMKVASHLMQFFMTSPVTVDWFRHGRIGDANLDGIVDVFDLLDLLMEWGPCAACLSDFDGDGQVNVLDLLDILSNWD